MKRPLAASLNVRLALKSKLPKREKEGPLTSFSKVVSFFLETFVTEVAIAETDADIMQLYELWNIWPVKYDETIWSQAVRRDRVFE